MKKGFHAARFLPPCVPAGRSTALCLSKSYCRLKVQGSRLAATFLPCARPSPTGSPRAVVTTSTPRIPRTIAACYIPPRAIFRLPGAFNLSRKEGERERNKAALICKNRAGEREGDLTNRGTRVERTLGARLTPCVRAEVASRPRICMKNDTRAYKVKLIAEPRPSFSFV